MAHLDRSLARNGFLVAVGQIVRLGDEDHRLLAEAALDLPDYGNLRSLLNASIGMPWRTSLLEALAEIGIIYAGELVDG